jgi:uncharacterized membrane-anchored protein YjiN (DUF445 family)
VDQFSRQTEFATSQPLHPEDAARRRSLKRKRVFATGLLLAMATIAAATHFVPEPGFWFLLLRAGTEAGVVGGLADWFAVTALFRRPLGLPIPHTAIIPGNKDRIGRTLGRFVERNFLTEEALLPKLREKEIGRHAAEWLARPETAPLIAGSITATLPRLAKSLASPELHGFVQTLLKEELRQADIAPVIGRVVHALFASGEADTLFERVAGILLDRLERNRDEIDRLITERSRWWIPKAIDRKLARAIVDGVSDVLQGLRDPDSETRAKFRAALLGFIDEMLNSDEQRRHINDVKNRILEHPDFQAWLGSVASELSDLIVADAERPDSRIAAALEKAVRILGSSLAKDAAMQAYLDQLVERFAVSLIGWREQIGNFIAEVVKTWDARTVSDRLELVVGGDLQYIRINGTLVGGLAGCLIFLLTRLLP